ncbi:hypothetical protein B0H10DRAFT_1939507 [Mycena sp. CBHHK59/15]|nr:hypothetical protein B0H10DRAFT_1939507 [Mycena sp. CBHHK59/15]
MNHNDIGCPVLPRDEQIFMDVNELLNSLPPDLETLVYKMKSHVPEVTNEFWFARWGVINGNTWYKALFLSDLRTAHECKEYQPIINRLRHLEATIQEILGPLWQNMEKVVIGERGLKLWSPKEKGKYTEFLEKLQIPVDSEMKPDMLLHDLGKLQEDLNFRRRLYGLFEPGKLAHKFLVNASGSGKTRLVLEGLSKYWGIYFTAFKRVHDHGSCDMDNILEALQTFPSFCNPLLHHTNSSFHQHLKHNRTITKALIRFLFLARLWVFRMFIDIMEAIPTHQWDEIEVYRQRWLCLQIQPSMLVDDGSDIFHDLTSGLVQYLGYMGPGRLKMFLESDLKFIRTTCRVQTLYVIVDEVQHAAESYFDAFRSEFQDKQGNPIPCPVLR